MAIDHNILLGGGPSSLQVAQNQLLTGLGGLSQLQQMQDARQLAPLQQQLLRQRVDAGQFQQQEANLQRSRASVLYGMQKLRGLSSPQERLMMAPQINAEAEALFGAPIFDESGVDVNQLSDQYLDASIGALTGQRDAGLTEFQRQNLDVQRQRLDLERERIGQADDRLKLQTEKLESAIDTALQEALNKAKARGTGIGKDEALKLVGAPEAINIANDTVSVIDEVLGHPGLAGATGFEGTISPANFIPGTDEYDFALKLEQLQGKAFLNAFETLKGGGQITQIEGEKATDAIGQLSRKQSTEQFIKSLEDLKSTALRGRENAEKTLSKESENPNETKENEGQEIRSGRFIIEVVE